MVNTGLLKRAGDRAIHSSSLSQEEGFQDDAVNGYARRGEMLFDLLLKSAVEEGYPSERGILMSGFYFFHEERTLSKGSVMDVLRFQV